MTGMICGNMIGGAAPLKTLIIEDENGTQLTAVVTDTVKMFDANPVEDIRAGKTAVTDDGIVIGSAIIPNYETFTGQRIITAGSKFKLTALKTHDAYDYTELQCIICPFNSSVNESVAAEKVVIDHNVYNVNSVVIVATVIKDSDNKIVDFNFTNTANVPYIIRYFTYKKLYGE